MLLMPGTSSCTASQAWRVSLKARMVTGLYDLWLCELVMSWPLQGEHQAARRISFTLSLLDAIRSVFKRQLSQQRA
jgi:hypothetical protein